MGKFVAQAFTMDGSGLLFVSITTFLLMHAIPGGPFSQEKALPPQTIAQLNKKYNLDSPLHVQFSHYMGDIMIPVNYDRQTAKIARSRLSD